jgi:hypothetical protein
MSNQIRSTVIRNELNMFHLSNRIRNNRPNWVLHVERRAA